MSKDTGNVPAARRSRRIREVLSWGKCPPETLRSFISALVDNGCAVLFGRTMDGGALMYTALCGNDKWKEYITSYADIVPALAQTLDDVVGDTDLDQPAPKSS